MLYFQTLPKILSPDNSGNSIVMTNLMVRPNIIPEMMNNPVLYYDYDIQDSDTPEIVAYKYYGSVDQYWILMYVNQMMDPQWSWPLTTSNFERYINEKYGTVAAAKNSIHHYEKYIYTQDSYTGEPVKVTNTIGEEEYNSITEGTEKLTFSNGDTVTVTIEKGAITDYVNELNINESKRTIKIFDIKYVSALEKQFKKLMV